MARYSLNLPQQLKEEAEQWSARQGITLQQFILGSVAQRVGELKHSRLDDPSFPEVTYRWSASGQPVAVVRGTGVRVQTLVICHENWGMSEGEIAEQYDLAPEQVAGALGFYRAHQQDIDSAIAAEAALEPENQERAASDRA